MKSHQAFKDLLTQLENITPFVTKHFQGIGQEVKLQDHKKILLAVQTPLSALRKSWIVCPNNRKRYSLIFFTTLIYRFGGLLRLKHQL